MNRQAVAKELVAVAKMLMARDYRYVQDIISELNNMSDSLDRMSNEEASGFANPKLSRDLMTLRDGIDNLGRLAANIVRKNK
jgi:hypothetical protein